MHIHNSRKEKLIYIIVDCEYKIHYSNVENKVAYNYIKRLNILEKLSEEKPACYILEDYYICIDKFFIDNNTYYIIAISQEVYKCSNCTKRFRDLLTGLYNRNYLEEQINNSKLIKYKLKNYCLIFIDIDNLKGINDNYGHVKGDKVIKIVGESIKDSMRKEDIAIRYGGDEFIILTFNQNKKIANSIIQTIKKEIRQSIGKEKINISISAGIACTDCFINFQDMLRIADKDLYEEKKMKKYEGS
ncbi:MAG TPA: GGDEF domain-containing protein [Tissierellales bacterium]|nr:GGDEF domain-containing protein [Tissierellales bacterium]